MESSLILIHLVHCVILCQKLKNCNIRELKSTQKGTLQTMFRLMLLYFHINGKKFMEACRSSQYNEGEEE